MSVSDWSNVLSVLGSLSQNEVDRLNGGNGHRSADRRVRSGTVADRAVVQALPGVLRAA